MPFSTNLFNYKPIYQGEAVKEYDDYITEAVKTYDTAQNNATLLNKTLASFKAKALPGQQKYIDEVMNTVNGSLEKIATDVHGGKRWEGALSQVNDLAMTLAGDPHLEVISESYKNYVAAKAEEQKQISNGFVPYMIGDKPETFNSLDRPFSTLVVPKGDWTKEIEDKVALVVPELREELDLEKSDPAHGVMVWKTSQGNMRANKLKSIIKDSFTFSSEFQNMKSIYSSLGKDADFDRDVDAMVNDMLALKTFESVRYNTNRTAVDDGGSSGKTKQTSPNLLSPQKLGQDNIQEKELVSERDFKNKNEKTVVKPSISVSPTGIFLPTTEYNEPTDDVKESAGYKKMRSVYDHLPDGKLKTEFESAMASKNYKAAAALTNEVLNKERSLVNYVIPVSGELAISPSMKSAIKVGMAKNNAGFVNDVKVSSVTDGLQKALMDRGMSKEKALDAVVAIKDGDISIEGVVFRGTDKERSSIGSIRAVWNGIPFTVPVTGDLKDRLEPFENVMRKAQDTKMGKPSIVEFPVSIPGIPYPITIKGTLRKYLDVNGDPQVHIEPDLSIYGQVERDTVIRPMLAQIGGKFSLNDVVNIASQHLQNSEFINGQK